MEYSFSFSGGIYEKLMNKYEYCIPGITKMVLCYNGDNAAICSLYKEAGRDIIKDIILKEHLDYIERLMRLDFTYKWLKTDEIPFEKKVKRIKKDQLEIFDEVDIPVLLIRLESGLKKIGDLLFVFLDKDASANFSMSTKPEPYSKQTKEFLGYFLYNLANKDLKDLRSDQQTFWNLLYTFNQIKQDSLAESEDTTSFEEFQREWCNCIIEDLSSGTGKTVRIDDKACSFLFESRSDARDIMNTLKEAYDFSVFSAITDEVIITKAEIKAVSTERVIAGKLDNSLKRAEEYLDLFEGYAQKEPANTPISIKNIISAWGKKSLSAVTVAINTRPEAVKKLLELYPERWPRIRAELAPVRAIDKEIRKKLSIKTG